MISIFILNLHFSCYYFVNVVFHFAYFILVQNKFEMNKRAQLVFYFLFVIYVEHFFCWIQRLLTTIYCLISDGNSPCIQSVRLTGQQNKSHINYTDLPTSNDSYRLSWTYRTVANRIEVYFEKWHRKKQHQTNFLAKANKKMWRINIIFVYV